MDNEALKRLMIRRAIEEHLDKELRLRPQGIKVLTLFFIDAVEHYRAYDADGNPAKGKYARLFEEEYRIAAEKPKYRTLFKDVDLDSTAEEVHEGYFSIDKKGRLLDTAENNQSNRDNAERAYNLIMKDKERLLSFETKLKFIFSHSALREGWDNPNVFQICVLRDMGTEMARRQSIGRGLRLCVNQDGQRIRGFDINTLTVIATESYEQFAEKLQQEIEADTGFRFGIVQEHDFAAIAVVNPSGQTVALGMDASKEIRRFLIESGFLNQGGKIQDKLRTALKDDTLQLPDQFKDQLPQVKDILGKLAGKLDIKNSGNAETVRTRRAILDGEGFRSLWDRIKHKTTYRVEFDNEKLVQDCAEAIKLGPPIAKTRVRYRKADLAIGKGGVDATETAASAPTILEEQDIVLPDILTDLQDKTQLTRKTIVRILKSCERLEDFKKNPQQFIEIAAEVINRCKRLALVDGIKYQRIGDDFFYAQELFGQEELRGYLENMLKDTRKSVFEHVVYDSETEHTFARDLEKNDAIKVYAKLPGWFKVPTPLGTYNPDWAVLVEANCEERLYFVVETKGSLFTDDLRHKEYAKSRCGEAHFEAIAVDKNPAKFERATKLDDVLDRVGAISAGL